LHSDTTKTVCRTATCNQLVVTQRCNKTKLFWVRVEKNVDIPVEQIPFTPLYVHHKHRPVGKVFLLLKHFRFLWWSHCYNKNGDKPIYKTRDSNCKRYIKTLWIFNVEICSFRNQNFSHSTDPKMYLTWVLANMSHEKCSTILTNLHPKDNT